MRQQEYNEIQDIKRNTIFFIIFMVLGMSLMVISADASEECISWDWIQTGSHTECSGWYCWYVPDYSFVCTGYAEYPTPEPTIPAATITPEPAHKRPTSIGFAYTFGHNDTERYQIQKNISDMRAMYIMENIAYENGLTMQQFEQKYNIR